jgi:hypothetical protein
LEGGSSFAVLRSDALVRVSVFENTLHALRLLGKVGYQHVTLKSNACDRLEWHISELLKSGDTTLAISVLPQKQSNCTSCKYAEENSQSAHE